MICLKIETQEPVHLAASREVSSFSSTLDFVPGTTLRGALARQYLEQPGSEAGDLFNWIFLDENNWFSPLFPCGEEFTQDSYVIPMTAYTCKHYPGFSPRQHGVVDLLTQYLNKEKVFIPKCARCNADLVPLRGFYSTLGVRTPSHLIEVKKRLITKSALDSRTETAASSQLYTTEVIEEGQKFIGFISLQGEEDFDLEEILKDFLCNLTPLQLGNSKSRGLGLVRVQSAESCNDGLFSSDDQNFDNRMSSFNQLLDDHDFDREGKTHFSLSLLTDCIIQDNYLRFSHALTPDILSRYYSPEFEQVELIHQFASAKVVESWNALHRLPRQAQAAIQAGSVFVYRIIENDNAIIDGLKQLEKGGVGERKTEGFGRVIINHPFHTAGEVY